MAEQLIPISEPEAKADAIVAMLGAHAFLAPPTRDLRCDTAGGAGFGGSSRAEDSSWDPTRRRPSPRRPAKRTGDVRPPAAGPERHPRIAAIFLSPDLRVSAANSTARTLLGWTNPDEAIGLPALGFVLSGRHPPDHGCDPPLSPRAAGVRRAGSEPVDRACDLVAH
jgi:hypothetical protein